MTAVPLHHKALVRGLRALLGPGADSSVQILSGRATLVDLSRGQVLFHQGDPGEHAFVLLSGGLLVTFPGSDGRTRHRELGPGEVLGELALLLQGPRTATVTAMREAQVARLHREDFEQVLLEQPESLLALTRTLASRLAKPAAERPGQPRCVALIPLSARTALRPLARSLLPELQRLVDAVLVDRASAQDAQGEGLFDRLRDQHALTLMLGDAEQPEWNRRILGVADLVLFVGGDQDPAQAPPGTEPAPAGEALWQPRRWLARLHPSDRLLPTPSAPWLDALQPQLHLNMRQGKVEHLQRLARLLTGRGVGLALGGGAARGFAHFGAVLALREHGVPVDLLSGSSAGSLAAVLIAQEGPLREAAAQGAARLTKRGNPFADLTLPSLSLVRGRRIREALQRVFGDQRLEDLWIPVRVAVTDLSAGCLRSYDRGEAWRLTLASGSPPGLTPPVVVEGRLCCDAGVLDNLPIGLLTPPCGVRIASQVSRFSQIAHQASDLPGPWQMAWSQLRRRPDNQVPNIAQILTATVALAGSRRVREAAQLADLHFDPDLESFSVLDFGAHEALIQAAFDHASAQLRASSATADLGQWLRGERETWRP